MRSWLFILLLLHTFQSIGQLGDPAMESRLGQLYVYWGYNRAYYSRSDVHFKGEGYDFTLERAWAEDMPEKFDPKVYFNPTQLTVPQFNFRIGYFFKQNTAISLGWDHMKYHLVPTQFIKINGTIDPERYPFDGYNGQFNHEYILYNPAFMNYHHSDGFNFVRIALEQRFPFWQSKKKRISVAMHGGVSTGFMLPWTDFTFFGKNYENKPHVSGIGASLNAGARFTFMTHYFVQINAQVGWTHMGDILLQWPDEARAAQNISFVERSWALGAYIPCRSKKTQD